MRRILHFCLDLLQMTLIKHTDNNKGYWWIGKYRSCKQYLFKNIDSLDLFLDTLLNRFKLLVVNSYILKKIQDMYKVNLISFFGNYQLFPDLRVVISKYG
jgi:hypothetical protein